MRRYTKTGTLRCAHEDCRAGAQQGYTHCRQHGFRSKYYIAFTWQEKAGDHWTQKKRATWPILFYTHEQAQTHMDHLQGKLFANMPDRRKLTACVERTKRVFLANDNQPTT